MAATAVDEDFVEWASSVERALLRSCVLLTGGDRQLAEDLVQQGLVAVAMRWDRLRDGNPEAYARVTAYRTYVSWWRRRRRERIVADLPERAAPAPTEVETRLVVAEALGRLTVKQRAVLVLRFLDDLSEAETAAVLGVSTGTVKSRTHMALRRLRLVAPELGALVGREVDG